MNKRFKAVLLLVLAFTLVVSSNAAAGMFGDAVAFAKEKEADTPEYYIKVNKTANTVTVYGKNNKGKYTETVKVFLCSCGEHTPVGTYRTTDKYRWRALVENTWGQYATRITGSILFHSVPYTRMSPDSLMKGEFDKLGNLASHGCVRLAVNDAKWIYDNCVSGTTVTIFEGDDPDPVSKPSGRKIGDEATWDPTDIWSEGNPYDLSLPRIVCKSVVTVADLDDFYELNDVKAYSSIGDDISDSVEMEGTLSDAPGVYRIIYSITDEFGRENSKVRIVKVKGRP